MMQSRAILLCAFSTALAACGGGGGGDPVVTGHINTGNVQASIGNTQNTTPNATQTYNGFSVNTNGKVIKTLGSNTLDAVVVDGQTITLKYPGFSAGRSIRLNHQLISGNFLSYSRFSLAPAVSNSTDAIVLSVGEVTKDMPTAGTARYAGVVFERRQIPYNTGIAGISYDADFSANVNFGAKTITGEFKNLSAALGNSADTTRSFTANINGADFTGTGSNGITKVSGKFYGPQAAEIGGVYAGETAQYSFVGAFGGNKQ